MTVPRHESPLLAVTDLEIRREGEGPDAAPLVSVPTLEIAAGARAGVIGESGSGKSLSALAVLGLLPRGLAATGSVRLDGVELVGARPAALNAARGAGMAAVFQEPLTALDPLMPIGRQLSWPLAHHRGLRGAALARAVTAALAEVSLPDPERLAQRRIHEVSGGQRQRVALALALACDPRLLIADEPTTALDLGVQDQILTLLERVTAERGSALLLISHDLAVVARMTEHLTVLRAGSVVERGETRALLSSPAHPYTRLLLETARTLEGYLPAAETRPEATR